MLPHPVRPLFNKICISSVGPVHIRKHQQNKKGSAQNSPSTGKPATSLPSKNSERPCRNREPNQNGNAIPDYTPSSVHTILSTDTFCTHSLTQGQQLPCTLCQLTRSHFSQMGSRSAIHLQLKQSMFHLLTASRHGTDRLHVPDVLNVHSPRQMFFLHLHSLLEISLFFLNLNKTILISNLSPKKKVPVIICTKELT